MTPALHPKGNTMKSVCLRLALMASPFLAFPHAATAFSPAPDSNSTLVSDFEDGLGNNLLNGRWFYFSDEGNGGNSRITSADSVSGWWDSTSVGLGYGGSKYSGVLGFRFGDKKAGTCDTVACNQWNDAGIGTDMRWLDSAQNLTGAVDITFWAKAAQPAKVTFLLGTANIKDYSFYRQSLAVSKDWKQFTVTLKKSAVFNQATWGSPQLPLDLSQVTNFSWDVNSADNPSLKGDTIYLDDIRVNGWKWKDPFETGIRVANTGIGGRALHARIKDGMLRLRLPTAWSVQGGSLSIGNAAGRELVRVRFRAEQELIEAFVPGVAEDSRLFIRMAR
jgi:hypothetical protein